MPINSNEDLNKLECLYKQYKCLLYNIAYNILSDKYYSEDAVQQTFVHVIENLHKVKEINAPETRNYIAIICRNTALNIYNKRTYLNKQSESINEICISTCISKDIADIVICNESIQQTVSAIKELKPIYRDALLLYIVYGYSLDDIAVAFDIKKDNVKKRIARAKTMLRDKLEKENAALLLPQCTVLM